MNEKPIWMINPDPALSSLANIRHQMLTQDNRSTSYPIFEVRDKVVFGKADRLRDPEYRIVTKAFFFTEKAADDYIRANSDDLEAPFTYVSSAYDNPELRAVMELLVSEDCDLLLKARIGDAPVTHRGCNLGVSYREILFDPSLQLKYQDVLDSMFGERIVDVRNELRALGWNAPDRGTLISEDGKYAILFEPMQVGAGKNVVGGEWSVIEIETRKKIANVKDLLTNTPAMLAGVIDDAMHFAAPDFVACGTQPKPKF
jgi:hypothetical protein